MEQSKQDDKTYWGEAGSLRIRRRIYRALADIGATVVDAYKVVHPQEPLWVFNMRLAEPDGDNIEFVLVFLRSEDGGFGRIYSADEDRLK